ncbi:MAG: 3-oxoacyl-[acyl-carrier-protein] reductase [Paludibacteraceae bacterium]|nr:3-oxoacyl-[acyl-carrier-protein] reductase [Paludibacteraceae bacterium]
MKNLLEGKIVLITGASRGIGKAIAKAMAAEGASIAFTHTSMNGALETEKELAEMGVKVKRYQSDASNYDEAVKVVNDVVATWGRVDVLVNNAGITRDALLMRMSPENWDEVINKNLKSVYNYSQACSSVMLRQRSGCIVNMSSVVGLHGNAGQCNYAASKAGIIGLTQSLAKEFGSRGIRVNAIAPGYIQTDMTQSLSEEVKKMWINDIPLKRAGVVEDIASVAVFLASEMSAYITGQVLQVDGGKCI